MITLDNIQELANGHRYAEYLAILCPFHDDRHPSCFVYEDGFYCKSCGAGGDLNKLFRKLKGQDKVVEFKNFALPWYRWLKDRTIEEFALYAHKNLISFPDQATYLKKRKIDSLIGRLKLGWTDGYYTFPIWNCQRDIVGMVARTGSSLQNEMDIRYITPPHQDPQLFVPGWKRIDKSDVVYFPFGIIDCLTLFQLGYPVMTWSVGKSVQSESLENVRKKIIIIPDLNEESDAMELANRLGWRGKVKRLDYPDKCKDINDIFIQHGEQVLISLLN